MQKLSLVILLFSALLFGCLSSFSNQSNNEISNNIEFNTYENQLAKVSFKTPATWVQQPKLEFVALFNNLQNAFLSVSVVPDATASDFDTIVTATYSNFQQNSGLFNNKQQNVTFANSQAVLITSDQRSINSTTNQEVISTSDLYIIKDVANNRLLLVSFVVHKDSASEMNEIKAQFLNSFRILN
ncbi:MAG: hypothetical protein V1644_03745 [Candidatus Micrarchaeota archaeon]